MADPDPAALPGPVPVLASARLRLRPYRDDDDAAMFALYSDPAVMRYWSFPPWTALEQARDYLTRARAQAAEGVVLPWALAAPDDGLIGTATLYALNREQGRAEIGYSLATAWQGRGLAAEALGLVLDHAFGGLGLRKVEADVDPRNTASCRLLERLGFQREGLLRERWQVAGETCDTAWFGLLAREHAARRAAAGAAAGSPA